MRRFRYVHRRSQILPASIRIETNSAVPHTCLDVASAAAWRSAAPRLKIQRHHRRMRAIRLRFTVVSRLDNVCVGIDDVD